MHVAIFHPAKLPVTKYGGTERIVVWLARGLAKLGHRVTLIAGRGTNVPEVDVVEVDVRKAIRHDFSLTPHLPATVDLVHYFVPIHELSPIPHLWTMQGNGRPGFDDLVNEAERWDAHTCRARAEEFSHLVMAERYVEQYRHLLEHGTLKPVTE